VYISSFWGSAWRICSTFPFLHADAKSLPIHPDIQAFAHTHTHTHKHTQTDTRKQTCVSDLFFSGLKVRFEFLSICSEDVVYSFLLPEDCSFFHFFERPTHVMNLCMRICICMCVYAHGYTHFFERPAHAMNVCMRVCMCICVYAQGYTLVPRHLHMYACMNIQIYT
jgi:hypothetical protein